MDKQQIGHILFDEVDYYKPEAYEDSDIKAKVQEHQRTSTIVALIVLSGAAVFWLLWATVR